MHRHKLRRKPLDRRCCAAYFCRLLVCSTCGGKRRPVQVVNEGPVARKILEHLGLPSEVAARTPYRPEPELWDTGPPEHLDQRPPDIDWEQRIASDSEAC